MHGEKSTGWGNLCFPEYKLALEYDGSGHGDQDVNYQLESQIALEKGLELNFITTYPDMKDFCIFRVTYEIPSYIKNQIWLNQGIAVRYNGIKYIRESTSIIL